LKAKGEIMSLQGPRVFHTSAWVAAALVASFVLTQPAEARVKKIVIEKKVSPAFDGASFGSAGKAAARILMNIKLLRDF
jgi:hypothetical protein